MRIESSKTSECVCIVDHRDELWRFAHDVRGSGELDRIIATVELDDPALEELRRWFSDQGERVRDMEDEDIVELLEEYLEDGDLRAIWEYSPMLPLADGPANTEAGAAAPYKQEPRKSPPPPPPAPPEKEADTVANQDDQAECMEEAAQTGTPLVGQA